MMIKIKDKDVELKFVYNSFKYMENLDLGKLDQVENKPFMLIDVTEQLLYGAVNNNPDVHISLSDVQEYVEAVMNEGSFGALYSDLLKLLEDSSFFKSLQQE